MNPTEISTTQVSQQYTYTSTLALYSSIPNPSAVRHLSLQYSFLPLALAPSVPHIFSTFVFCVASSKNDNKLDEKFILRTKSSHDLLLRTVGRS